MRIIERSILKALWGKQGKVVGNTEVRFTKDKVSASVLLFGNIIATIEFPDRNPPKAIANLNTLYKYPTPTTFSRLRSLGFSVGKINGEIQLEAPTINLVGLNWTLENTMEVSIEVNCAAFDHQNGLDVIASPLSKSQDTFMNFFGVSSAQELDYAIDSMNEGEGGVYNFVSSDYKLPLLDCISVAEMDNVKYSLVDLATTINSFENTSTYLLEDDFTNEEAAKLGAWTDDIKWYPETSTLEDSGNTIKIKRIREITPQQALVFKLSESF